MHIEKTTRGVTIDDVDQGIRARSTGVVEVDDADISALSVGVNAAPGTPVRLAGSHLDALEAIRGEVIQDGVKDLSLPPLNLLGAIGVPLVVLALLLELVDNYRHRGTERTERRAPPDLTVTARGQLGPAGRAGGSPSIRRQPHAGIQHVEVSGAAAATWTAPSAEWAGCATSGCGHCPWRPDQRRCRCEGVEPARVHPLDDALTGRARRQRARATSVPHVSASGDHRIVAPSRLRISADGVPRRATRRVG